MQNGSEKCTITTTLSVMGGKWKAVILWHLIDKTRRFSDIKRLIPDIAQKMLTQQLRELEQDRLIQRKVYAEVPPPVEYSLTAYGKTLIPVLNAMAQWGLEHEQSGIRRSLGDDSEQT
jgi:DNA-binding HxlR family transcriptional regulator